MKEKKGGKRNHKRMSERTMPNQFFTTSSACPGSYSDDFLGKKGSRLASSYANYYHIRRLYGSCHGGGIAVQLYN